MSKRFAVVTVITSNRLDGVSETNAALTAQTIPCVHYLMVIGQASSLVTPANAIRVDLPLAHGQTLLASGIGLQLAFNEGADIVACIEPHEIARPHCLELVASELERIGADILELKHPDQDESESGTLFYTKSAAFVPGLWTQLLAADEIFSRDIINHIVSLHDVPRGLLISALIRRSGVRAVVPKAMSLRVPLADESHARRLYQQTGLLFGRVPRTRAGRANKVAVITPYYKEPLSKLYRCHQSVLHQGSNVRHIMVADGFARPELDQWAATHIKLPSAHGDNGNTPRGIGGMVAFAQGFDAVAYLDADNWFANEHIKSILQGQRQTGASVVCSWRTVVLPDGTVVEKLDPEDEKKSHVDTSCYLITREVAFLASLWARMPQTLGPICDRIFFGSACEAEPNIHWTHRRTVHFESNYLLHYRMARKIPDRPVHDIPPNLWRKIDSAEFRQRTGKTIALVRGQSAFSRRRPPSPVQKSHCGSGKV